MWCLNKTTVVTVLLTAWIVASIGCPQDEDKASREFRSCWDQDRSNTAKAAKNLSSGCWDQSRSNTAKATRAEVFPVQL